MLRRLQRPGSTVVINLDGDGEHLPTWLDLLPPDADRVRLDVNVATNVEPVAQAIAAGKPVAVVFPARPHALGEMLATPFEGMQQNLFAATEPVCTSVIGINFALLASDWTGDDLSSALADAVDLALKGLAQRREFLRRMNVLAGLPDMGLCGVVPVGLNQALQTCWAPRQPPTPAPLARNN